MKKLMRIKNARVPEQRAQMEDIKRRGICPFCRENFEADHKAPILFENRYWLLTENDYPYEGTRVHLLLVHKRHVEDVSGMTQASIKALLPVLKWAKVRFRISGGSFLMRFGDMRYNGATIAHLHAHIIVGVMEGRNTVAIKKKLGFARK